ncbi:MAG: T9SS type A sorting domain-containing protein [Candidatus Kapaibacterium sp.]
MSNKSRRDFIKKSLSLAAVAVTGPSTVALFARLNPVYYRQVDASTVAGTYTLKVSDFQTSTVGKYKIGLSEVGSSIKLTSDDELFMNPDHCERSGVDGENYPIAIVRVKESGEDAFTAVSTWCPHNNETQLDYFDHALNLFVCSHEKSTYLADGTWVPPADSPFPDAPPLNEFQHNIGPDGFPHLTSFATSFDGETLTIFDVLCECAPCITTSVDDDLVGYSLEQNYPNPASHLTVFRFSLPEAAPVSLKILSLDGEIVATPADRRMSKGDHSIDFDVRELPSGSYFYKLETPFGTRTRRMTVVK